MLPTACHGQFRDGITLCTLGSLHRVFPFRDRVHEFHRMLRYGYVIFYKASKVADEGLFPSLNCIGNRAYPYEINWPKTVFFGDPYQLPPNTESELPDPYYYIKLLSFLLRMAICSRLEFPE